MPDNPTACPFKPGDPVATRTTRRGAVEVGSGSFVGVHHTIKGPFYAVQRPTGQTVNVRPANVSAPA